MNLLILCPQWGSEHLPLEEFFDRVEAAGFDGLDTWLPAEAGERRRFLSLLRQRNLPLVAHQHQAEGQGIAAFCRSFLHHLHQAAEAEPLLINSHSGRDWFSLGDQLRVIDVAEEFTEKTGIRVLHETHRGRLGYCPANAQALFEARPTLGITADFSHWTCVTESFLDGYAPTLAEAIRRTGHVHARVGFEQGPQVPDPRDPAWRYALDRFTAWWTQILTQQRDLGVARFTLTTEFGPPPYLWTMPGTQQPLADVWELNLFMKNHLRGLG